MTRRRRQSGSLLIEFAGSLILLSTLFTGIFQVGYTFYTYENLVNAVRAGARYASLGAASDSATPEFATSVRNLVLFGDTKPAAGAKPIVAGIKPEDVEVTLEPRVATVSIRGFQIDSLFAKFKLDGRPTVSFPRARPCRNEPPAQRTSHDRDRASPGRLHGFNARDDQRWTDDFHQADAGRAGAQCGSMGRDESIQSCEHPQRGVVWDRDAGKRCAPGARPCSDAWRSQSRMSRT